MITLIQLERLGDLAQSVPALRTLVGAGVRPRLLVQEALAPFASRIAPAGAEVLPAPVDALSRLVSAANEGASAPREYVERAAQNLVEVAGVDPSHAVLNMTWHRAGAVLATLLAPDEALGGVISEAGEWVFRGFWGSYPLSAVDGRPHGRLHMQDLRRLMAAEAAGAAPRSGLSAARRQSNARRLVALVPGASDPARVWPAERFAELARALHGMGFSVAVVGTAAEAEAAATIRERSGVVVEEWIGGHVVDLLDELAEARLVVGADTGPLHVAALAGVPSVMIMSGRAFCWETGPTVAGSVALQAEPVGTRDAASVPVSAVLGGLRIALGESVDEIGPPPSGCRWYLAREAPEADPLGGVVYAPAGREVDSVALASRALLAALSGTSPVDADALELDAPTRDVLADVAERVLPVLEDAATRAESAEQALATGRHDHAVKHLSGLPARLEVVAEGLRAHPVSVPSGLALFHALQTAPPEQPLPTVARHARRLAALARGLGALALVPAPR